MPTYKISAILFEREDAWVAQCLEYDITAQADSLPNLYYELERVLVGHIVISEENGEEPFELLPAAPQEYWQMFDASKIKLNTDPLPFRLPRFAKQPPPELRELRVA
jgi:hypothetical protein